MDFGIDRLAQEPELAALLKGARVGLLAHPASVDRSLVHVSDVLARMGIEPLIIFGPEHGYGGEAQDMIGVDDARDVRGAPIRSLYGARFEDLSPRPEDLANIDVLVVDLEDIGSRYYTFVWTAVLAMRACDRAGVRMIVLDRPNPLGGVDVEGRLQKPGFLSFVGLEMIPVRHGLTLGEIVAWRAEAEGIARGCVTVIAAKGVERSSHAPSWDRPFVMPSPNMPTYETALVYPGGCLIEGTNLSEGRGTTRPFEIVGAPWLDGRLLAENLATLDLPGFRARAITFLPTFQKHAKQICGGVQIHVTDARAFRPVATYLALVALAHHAHPAEFRFRTEAYEFVDDVPAFNLLTGSDEARVRIESGDSAHSVAEARAVVRDWDLAIVATAREFSRAHMV